jgi:hypothetical protein
MRPKHRFTVRTLIGLIAAIAVALGLLRYPIFMLHAEARFRTRRERGRATIEMKAREASRPLFKVFHEDDHDEVRWVAAFASGKVGPTPKEDEQDQE